MARKPSAKAKGGREVEVRADVPVGGPPPPRRVGFEEIIGQQRALANLRAAMSAGRVHHAWIFDGPAGVGKFTTALAFAGALLDPTTAARKDGEIRPDPDSPTQQLLESGSHPDLHIVVKELAVVSRETSVRDSKQRTIAKQVLEEFLIEPAVMTSSNEGGLAAKVFIVDEAELIDRTGQNALLKTLEEPAPGSIIILVTSSEERLLPTIRSRCQRVAFVPLNDEEMGRWLQESGLDLSTLEGSDRAWLLSFADGSPGMAMLALATGLVEWRRALAPMLAEVDRGKFPLDMGTVMTKLADDWATAWVERPEHKHASKDAANKTAARQVFRLVADHYRGRLRAGADVPRALRAIDLVVEAERQAESNVSQAFVMENLVAQLASES